MTEQFKINIIYNSDQNIIELMKKLYVDYLKINLENLVNNDIESYNNGDKFVLAKVREEVC